METNLSSLKYPCITTRLDNDDMISPTFLSRIQQAAKGWEGWIDSRYGYKYDTESGLWYTHKERCGPFVSRVGMHHCLDRQHGKAIYQHDRVKEFPGRHWCMVIHDKNIINHITKHNKQTKPPEWSKYEGESR